MSAPSKCVGIGAGDSHRAALEADLRLGKSVRINSSGSVIDGHALYKHKTFSYAAVILRFTL